METPFEVMGRVDPRIQGTMAVHVPHGKGQIFGGEGKLISVDVELIKEQSYDDERDEVGPVPERVSILDVVHDVDPPGEADHLHTTANNTPVSQHWRPNRTLAVASSRHCMLELIAAA